MRLLVSLAFVAVSLAGCGNRTSLPEAEATTVHEVATGMEPGAAFLAVEEAMSDSWASWQDVNQLRQPETGTLSAKGWVPYTDVTGRNASFVSVKARVKPGGVTLTYVIGRNRHDWFPSESGVRQLREHFQTMTDSVAKGVSGAP
jgi:hypothetical protein